MNNLETLKKSLSDLNLEWESENTEINGYRDQKHSEQKWSAKKNDQNNFDLKMF